MITETKERPILFSAPMVRELLAGRKTQTRRMLNPQPPSYDPPQPLSYGEHPLRAKTFSPLLFDRSGKEHPGTEVYGAHGETWHQGSPHGQPGDRLWVRETWRAFERPEDGADGVLFAADGSFREIDNTLEASEQWAAAYSNGKHLDHWRPSIFMPRWASRLNLEITGVRVERLQDISESDAAAEGADEAFGRHPDQWSNHGTPEGVGMSRKLGFRLLWETTYGAECWNQNPWVWAVEFTKL